MACDRDATVAGRMEVTTAGSGPIAKNAMQCHDEPTTQFGVSAALVV